MTRNYAFLWDSTEKKVVDRAVGNGIELMGGIPYLCAKMLVLNHECGNDRYYVTLACATIFKNGIVHNPEFWAMMWDETVNNMSDS